MMEGWMMGLWIMGGWINGGMDKGADKVHFTGHMDKLRN